MGVQTVLQRQGLAAPISLPSPAPKFYTDFAHPSDIDLWGVDSGTWTHPLPTRVYRGRESAASCGSYFTVGSWEDMVIEVWVYPKDNVIANFYLAGINLLRQNADNNYFLWFLYDYRGTSTVHELRLGAYSGGAFHHWIIYHGLNFVNIPYTWYKIGVRKRGNSYTVWVTDKVNRDVVNGTDPTPLFVEGGVGLIAYGCEVDFKDFLVR